jgi:hypothetical protein
MAASYFVTLLRYHRSFHGVWITSHTVIALLRNWIDDLLDRRHNLAMSRYTFPAFNTSHQPRYVVLWDLHWQVLKVERLEPSADLSGAMVAAIERLEGDGWRPESTPELERRLLMLTPRDPLDSVSQTFSPFSAAHSAERH